MKISYNGLLTNTIFLCTFSCLLQKTEWECSVFSAQFCCESKIALQILVVKNLKLQYTKYA